MQPISHLTCVQRIVIFIFILFFYSFPDTHPKIINAHKVEASTRPNDLAGPVYPQQIYYNLRARSHVVATADGPMR